MLKLIIGNSFSQLKGLTVEQHKSLKDIMSYNEDPTAHYFSRSFRSPKRSLIDKKGRFPTGLLAIVEQWVLKHTCKVIDKRIKPASKPGMFRIKI